jgi:hypothetical protein
MKIVSFFNKIQLLKRKLESKTKKKIRGFSIWTKLEWHIDVFLETTIYVVIYKCININIAKFRNI